MTELGGAASLQQLYVALDEHPRTTSNPRNWRAKVRQTVQLDPEMERFGEGLWRLKSSVKK